MKRMLIWFWILSSTMLCLGQTGRNGPFPAKSPDLSGTWTLDIANSDLGQPRRDLLYDEMTLIILQNDPEVKITRKVVKNNKERSKELVYYSDGRGESNPGIESNETVKSKTKWAGDVLISESVHRIMRPGYVMSFEASEKWQLSDDGKTLLFTRSPATMHQVLGAGFVFGRVYPIKRVFRKVT